MKLRLLYFFLAIFLGGCAGSTLTGPLSLEQATNNDQIRLPLYYPSPESRYSQLIVEYYYFDSGSELRLDTYFISNDQNVNSARVAKMSIFNANGQLVTPEEVKRGSEDIKLAQGNYAGKCNVLSYNFGQETIAGNVYKSCLYWYGQDENRYKIYSIWTEDETANLVNSFIKAGQ